MALPGDYIGDPDFELAGLRLWIHGYEFPHLTDWHDGNWLIATAHYQNENASVWVPHEPMLLTWELRDWLKAMENLYRRLRGIATLEPTEPYLFVELRAANERGDIEMRLEITPDPSSEQHRFWNATDSSYLPDAMRQLQEILNRYPVRGRSDY
ncbi:MAG: hypothetical protein WHS44_09700 [Fimbriimonadales bacterium]|nr:MAG: hypothetical protein KatS3mg018_0201 [Fimbriimonadales bacterium]